MQDKHEIAQSSEKVVLTPFSEGSRPDAFRFMSISAGLCLIATCAFFLYQPDPLAVKTSVRFFCIGVFLIIASGSTLFCRVELGESQISSKGLLGKKTVDVRDIKSVGYRASEMFTQLVIRTDTDSVTFSSLSFSAHQLNVIRNYCDQFRNIS